MLTVRVATTSPDCDAALGVWQRANSARGLPATQQREARVREKVRAVDASLFVAVEDVEVVGMLLLEAGRPAPDSPYGHVSMIFVHPDCWGRGIGSALLDTN